MIACPVCDTESTDDFCDLRRCTACGHVFQHPPCVTAKYDADYIERYGVYPTAEMSLLRVGFLKGHVAGGRLLDVGYGNGAFLRAAATAGFQPFGYDIHHGDFGIAEIDIYNDRSRWDVITFFDSLEHFPSFAAVRSLIGRAGYVMVSLPLYPAAFPATRAWKHYKPGEHVHYFSRQSLSRLVGRRLIASSNLEDAIRRPSNGEQNILTCLFGATAPASSASESDGRVYGMSGTASTSGVGQLAEGDRHVLDRI
jgi:hypothetical protein